MIHGRQLFGSVSDYQKLYAEVLRALKPGGWYEQVEVDPVTQSEDGSIAGTGFEQWGPLTLEAAEKFGRSFRVINHMRQDMTEAGFEEIKEVRFKWPIGGWPKDKQMKEIGRYNAASWDQGMEGWVLYLFTEYLGVCSPLPLLSLLSDFSLIPFLFPLLGDLVPGFLGGELNAASFRSPNKGSPRASMCELRLIFPSVVDS